MLTQLLFTLIVLIVIVQRLFELRISKRHAAQLIAEGGREHSSNSLWLVKCLQISWFLAMILEVWWLDRPFIPGLAAIALAAAVTGQYLRYQSMRALGKRWTLPIITLPGVPVITSGVYQYLRHPNWLGVCLEISMLPLIHTAYFTALVFTVMNALLMIQRIQAEEKALTNDTNYSLAFAHRPRFLPKLNWRLN